MRDAGTVRAMRAHAGEWMLLAVDAVSGWRAGRMVGTGGARRTAPARPRCEGSVADLLEAVAEWRGRDVERLVLSARVSPFEVARGASGEPASALALAQRAGYDQALRFFDAWARDGSRARFRHSELRA